MAYRPTTVKAGIEGAPVPEQVVPFAAATIMSVGERGFFAHSAAKLDSFAATFKD